MMCVIFQIFDVILLVLANEVWIMKITSVYYGFHVNIYIGHLSLTWVIHRVGATKIELVLLLWCIDLLVLTRGPRQILEIKQGYL